MKKKNYDFLKFIKIDDKQNRNKFIHLLVEQETNYTVNKLNYSSSDYLLLYTGL